MSPRVHQWGEPNLSWSLRWSDSKWVHRPFNYDRLTKDRYNWRGIPTDLQDYCTEGSLTGSTRTEGSLSGSTVNDTENTYWTKLCVVVKTVWDNRGFQSELSYTLFPYLQPSEEPTTDGVCGSFILLLC